LPAFSAEPSEDSNLSIQTNLSEILIRIQQRFKKSRLGKAMLRD
jgi:hypothetical protein